MDWIMYVQSIIPCQLLLKIYGNKIYQITKNQTVEHVFTQLSGIVPTSANISDFCWQET